MASGSAYAFRYHPLLLLIWKFHVTARVLCKVLGQTIHGYCFLCYHNYIYRIHGAQVVMASANLDVNVSESPSECPFTTTEQL